jgi:hypothetical protein
MANWNKLNEELDSALDSMTSEEWIKWKNKNTITVCTGVGLNMFSPEYITIKIPNKKNTIITDWLEEHGDPEIEKEVIEHLEKTTLK